ncbi:MAG: FIST N-terminal domain-containing protein [Bacteroidota bacterium]
MIAKSIKGNSTEEIKDLLEQSMADGFTPTLAIVFLSIKQDHKAICRVLEGESIIIFGATTNGEFIDEQTQGGSAAILLLDMKAEYFTVLFDEFPVKTIVKKSGRMAKNALEQFAHPAFLISCSHIETDAEQLLLGFEDVVGKQVNVYGGAAGDDYSFSEQLVFNQLTGK